MGFWVFMLVMDLLIPLTLLGFGKYFQKGGPKEPNGLLGYRTARSMKNQTTWEFAQKYCGMLWWRGGLVSLPLSAAVMILLLGRGEDAVGKIGALLMSAQTFLLLVAIPLTERALKRTFGEDGQPR